MLHKTTNSALSQRIYQEDDQVKVINTNLSSFQSNKSLHPSDQSSIESRPMEIDIRHWQKNTKDTLQKSQYDLNQVQNNSHFYAKSTLLKNVVSQKYFSQERGKESQRNLLDTKMRKTDELSKMSTTTMTAEEIYQKSVANHPVISQVYIDDGRIKKSITNQSSQIILNKLVQSSSIAKSHFKHRSSNYSPSRFSTESVMRGGGGQKLLQDRQSFPTNMVGNIMRQSMIPQNKNKKLVETALDSLIKLAQIEQNRQQTEHSPPQKNPFNRGATSLQKSVVIEGYGSNKASILPCPENKISQSAVKIIPQKVQKSKDFISRNISGLPQIGNKRMGGDDNNRVDHDQQRLRLLKQLSMKESSKLNKIQLAELKGKDTVQCLRANIKWNANEFFIKAKSILSGKAKTTRELEVVRHYVDKFFAESVNLHQYKNLSNEDREITYRRDYFKITKVAELNEEANYLKKNLGTFLANHLRALKKYREDPVRVALNHKQNIIAKRMAKKDKSISDSVISSQIDEKEIYSRDSVLNVQKAQEGALRRFKKLKFEEQLKTLVQFQNDLVKKLDEFNIEQKLYKQEEEDFDFNENNEVNLNRQQLRMQQKLEDAMNTSDLYFKYQDSINQYLKEYGAEQTSIEAVQGLKKNVSAKDRQVILPQNQQNVNFTARRMSQDDLDRSLMFRIDQENRTKTFYPMENKAIQFDRNYFGRHQNVLAHPSDPPFSGTLPKLSIEETESEATTEEKLQDVHEMKAQRHIADSIIRKTKYQQEFATSANDDQQKQQKKYAKAQKSFEKFFDQHRKEEEQQRMREMLYLRSSKLVSARRQDNVDFASSSKLTFLQRLRKNSLVMLAQLAFANEFALQKKQEKFMKSQLITALEGKKDTNASQEDYENEDLNNAENLAQSESHGLFIDEVIREGSIPLPIFNKIDNKMLFLDNYQLDNQNLSALCQVLQTFVPNSLEKLILRNNTIDDKNLARIINKLSALNDGGLKVLALIKNQFEKETQDAFCKNYFNNSDALSNLKKFYIIEPLSKQPSYHNLVNGIRINAPMFTQLKSLCLQKMQMSRADMIAITEVVLKVPTLLNLNLADNGLTPGDLAHLFSQMTPLNQCIQYLNLSWNHASCQSKAEQANFDNQFAHFVRYSHTLQHLDVSGMQFQPSSLEQFCVKGMRKSKTLLSVHMNGNFNSQGLLDRTRKWLKVFRVNKRTQSNFNEEKYQPSSKVPQFLLDPHNAIRNQVQTNTNSEQLLNVVLRKQKKKQETLSQIMQDNQQYKVSDCVVFQRFLGHLEIINGQRWQEVDGNDCYICKKWAYCLFLWDQSIGDDTQFYQTLDKDLLKHLNIPQSRFCNSYISIESVRQVFPMLGISEFFSRLEDNMAHFEGNNSQDCETQERADRINKLKNHLIDFEKNPTQPVVPLKWIAPMVKQGIIEHKRPQGHTKDLINLYKRSEKSGALRICAAYLPPKQTSIIIQSAEQQGKSYFTGYHPTTQKKVVNMKPMKLVYRVHPSQLGFQKSQSLFAGFSDDNKAQVIQQQFESDWDQMKLDDLVGDVYELENIKKMFRAHYSDLLLIYLFQISCDVYPCTNWIEFSYYCQEWNLIEAGSLTMPEIYKIFLQLVLKPDEKEADSQLKINRHQFMEILVRMAACKYFQKYISENIQDAYEKLITDVILPQARVYPFDLEDWRAEFLYSKEVHNVYFANEDSLDQLFQTYAQKDILTYQQALGMIIDSQLDLQDDKITLAYSFSKKRIIREAEEANIYTQMNILEFYEFIGRIAFLVYPDPEKSFTAKLYRLFQIIFKMIGIKQVKELEQIDVQDSESDYEDGYAEEHFQKRYPDQVYAGFGLTCNL